MTSENDVRKFMEHIVETKGNPTSKVVKECNLEGYFCELCCRNVPASHMVSVAEKYLSSIDSN